MIIFEADTASVCTRNHVSDVTFYDSTSFIFTLGPSSSDRFPLTFIETGLKREARENDLLVRTLKEGEKIPAKPLNDDWTVFAVMTSVFLYSLISAVSRRFFQDMKRFFLFRGIGDPASRDMQTLFYWQSTIINLVTFFNVAFFFYCAADYFEFIPETIPGFLFWLLCLLLVIIMVSLRHMVCYITGNISNNIEVFNEYILTVYSSYRCGALILFLISVMMLYTGFVKTQILFISGTLVAAAFYIIRIIRLFLIFINKNVSVFYFILYLCALEFLPVVVLLKYFTGLF